MNENMYENIELNTLRTTTSTNTYFTAEEEIALLQNSPSYVERFMSEIRRNGLREYYLTENEKTVDKNGDYINIKEEPSQELKGN